MTVPYSPTLVSVLDIDFALLPLGIGANASGGPMTKTAVTTSSSGVEVRYAHFLEPRREYTGSFGPDYVEALMQLWSSGLGPRYGFMLHDPSDYKLELEEAVQIDSTHYQVTKTYARTNYFTGSPIRSLIRDILLLDPNTSSVFRDGVLDTSWTLDNNGVIVTSNPVTSEVITVTGEFFVPVRVADDQFVLTMHVKDLDSVQQIKFVELLPVRALVIP